MFGDVLCFTQSESNLKFKEEFEPETVIGWYIYNLKKALT